VKFNDVYLTLHNTASRVAVRHHAVGFLQTENPTRLHKPRNTYSAFVTVVINKILLQLINKMLMVHWILEDWHIPINDLE